MDTIIASLSVDWRLFLVYSCKSQSLWTGLYTQSARLQAYFPQSLLYFVHHTMPIGGQTLSALYSADPRKDSAFFFSLSCWAHQNLQIVVLISSQRLFVRTKHDIAYLGIACATALMRISLLAFHNSFSFHPWILFQTLSFKYAKVCFFDLLI